MFGRHANQCLVAGILNLFAVAEGRPGPLPLFFNSTTSTSPTASSSFRGNASSQSPSYPFSSLPGDIYESTRTGQTTITSIKNELTISTLALVAPGPMHSSFGSDMSSNNVPMAPLTTRVWTTSSVNQSTGIEGRPPTIENITVAQIPFNESSKTYNATWFNMQATNSSVPQWLNISMTTSVKLPASKTMNAWEASWASKCTTKQYPTDFAIGFIPDDPECLLSEGQGLVNDGWDNYAYEDRCLARWCYTNMKSRTSEVQATWVKTWLTTTFVEQDSWLKTVYKTTLTASDENPIDYYVYMTEAPWTYTGIYVDDPSDHLTVDRPCCGQCTIQVDNLNLYYWPDFAGTVTAAPTLSIPRGTGKPIWLHDPTEIPPDTWIETINGTVTTIVVSYDNPNCIEVVNNGTTTCEQAGDPRTFASNAKRDAASVSSVDSIVDENGFTFISPSVYIAFTSLMASDSCGTIGYVPVTTTMALDPLEISTLTYISAPYPCYQTTLTRPITWSDIVKDCATIRPGLVFDPDWRDNWRFTEDRCHPYIAIPTRLLSQHPGWNTCIPSYAGGLHDPPKTLAMGTALVPTTQEPKFTPTATPAPKSRDPIVTATWDVQDPLQPSGADGAQIPTSPGEPAATIAWPLSSVAGASVIPIPIVSGGRPQLPQKPAENADPQIEDAGSDPNGIDPGASKISILAPLAVQTTPAPGITWQGAVITINDKSHVVVDGTTLSPGNAIIVGQTTRTFENGFVTTQGGHTLSLDPIRSNVVVDGSQTLMLPHAAPSGGAKIVFGGTAITLPEGRLSMLGGTTTVAPVQVDMNDGVYYAMVVDGVTSPLRQEQISAMGGKFVDVLKVTEFTVNLPASTMTLSNGEISVIEEVTKVITATMADGVDSVELVVGGHTTTLPNGQVTVVGGKTVTSLLRGQSFEATINNAASQSRTGGQVLSETETPSVRLRPQTGSATGLRIATSSDASGGGLSVFIVALFCLVLLQPLL